MADPVRRHLNPVESEPTPVTQSCRNCQKRNRKIEKLRRDNTALRERVEQLIRAIQRESHHYDIRTSGSGR